MRFEGPVWKFGDHVNTDLIIPARYLTTSDPAELAKHAMEDADPAFPQRFKPGGILVGGVNFGCGSSREHAPIALKGAGVACVVAKSFARIFYRNGINIGLPLLICAEAGRLAAGETVAVDLGAGKIQKPDGTELTFEDTPPLLQEIIAAGGLMPWTRNRAP